MLGKFHQFLSKKLWKIFDRVEVDRCNGRSGCTERIYRAKNGTPYHRTKNGNVHKHNIWLIRSKVNIENKRIFYLRGGNLQKLDKEEYWDVLLNLDDSFLLKIQGGGVLKELEIRKKLWELNKQKKLKDKAKNTKLLNWLNND